MATKAETPMTDQNAAFAAAIAAGIQSGIAQMNKPPLKEGDPEYVARLRAEGLLAEFEKPVFQNGYAANPIGESEETISRASRLAPGKYLGGRVRVDVTPQAVFINYPTVDVTDRMKNMKLWTSFGELITKIWAEMHAHVAA